MTALSKLIHTGFGQLGIREEAEQRAVLVRTTGKPSLRDMVPAEEEAVVAELERLGFKRSSKRFQGSSNKPALDGKYLPKMRALWIALYNLGEVYDRRDSAIEEFALGRQLPHLDGMRFIHRAEDGRSVVEAMKGWLTRAGVVWSEKRPCPEYMAQHGYKIAQAQWRKLYPSKAMQAEAYFWATVTGLIDVPDGTRVVTDAQWIKVMNYLGKQVRALKKKGGA